MSDVVLASWLYLAEDFSCQPRERNLRELPGVELGTEVSKNAVWREKHEQIGRQG